MKHNRTKKTHEYISRSYHKNMKKKSDGTTITPFRSSIKVVGVGGSGCNAVNRMAKAKMQGVELIALNCDIQDLKKIKADKKIQIGAKLTHGLGAGMKPEIGKKAVQESKEEIREALQGANIVFITCGLGGGTGTLASGQVAEIAKNLGALVIAVVTLPFSFEGKYRARIARLGLKDLKSKVDTLLIIPNDKILSRVDKNTSLSSAFLACDKVLHQAVQGISDLIVLPGIVNVDFADIKTIMKNSGPALFGVGKGKGEKKIEQAVRTAINSPLLNFSIKGARGILFNISGGENLSLKEINKAADMITKNTSPQAKVIFGATISRKLKKDEVKITVIATGFEEGQSSVKV